MQPRWALVACSLCSGSSDKEVQGLTHSQTQTFTMTTRALVYALMAVPSAIPTADFLVVRMAGATAHIAAQHLFKYLDLCRSEHQSYQRLSAFGKMRYRWARG